jgi:hypothetical protein
MSRAVVKVRPYTLHRYCKHARTATQARSDAGRGSSSNNGSPRLTICSLITLPSNSTVLIFCRPATVPVSELFTFQTMVKGNAVQQTTWQRY